MKWSSCHVADAFLAFSEEHGDALTNLKLQKLLYYAQGWWLARHDAPLFDEPLQAWVHGPVEPKVYQWVRSSGSKSIERDPQAQTWDSFEPELKSHVEDVWSGYGHLSAYHLETMTHREPPWREARNGHDAGDPSEATLSLDAMTRFFKEEVAQEEGRREAKVA